MLTPEQRRRWDRLAQASVEDIRRAPPEHAWTLGDAESIVAAHDALEAAEAERDRLRAAVDRWRTALEAASEAGYSADGDFRDPRLRVVETELDAAYDALTALATPEGEGSKPD